MDEQKDTDLKKKRLDTIAEEIRAIQAHGETILRVSTVEIAQRLKKILPEEKLVTKTRVVDPPALEEDQ